MANDLTLTIIGNITQDVEMRFTPSGSAVANLTIASTPSSFDKQANAFKDGETTFMRCSIWREQAENAVESLSKGMRVIAQGRLKSRSYEAKDGTTRTVMELEIDEIGPSLKYASAKVTRTQKGAGNGGQQQAQQRGGFGQQSQAPAQGNWGQLGGQQQQASGGWGAPNGDQPPAY